ncbi:MAG: GNAT family N-acetyltransferase [Acidimicrobiia bacterium]|nr:GNAT family N-acetyltransferase [Acidimicrobiia bacterium]
MDPHLVVEPVTADRWDDLERLFGERGASSGCWCMWWRKSAKEWDRDAGAVNRQELRSLVRADPAPGLLAFRDDEPVGWVALAPRDAYPRLQRSRNLGPVDDAPVWLISCFYIDRHHRGTGVATALLAGAIRFARANGARAVEGVPIDTSARTPANADLYTGTLAMFLDQGFEEVARRNRRPIVRCVLR